MGITGLTGNMDRLVGIQTMLGLPDFGHTMAAPVNPEIICHSETEQEKSFLLYKSEILGTM